MSTLPALTGRERELARLGAILDAPGTRVVTIAGPRGRGKTALLAAALEGRDALHFQGAELTEGDLLEDLESLARARLGAAPVPLRPGVLPTAPGRGGWPSFLAGIRDRVEATGEPFILGLDGMESLISARRRLPSELAELVQASRARGLPLCLVLTARNRATLDQATRSEALLGPAELHVDLPPIPYRRAGWGHGARNPRDAFLRWALLGDHPAHLSRGDPREELDELLIRRVLSVGGDLFEAPLRRIEAGFQRPSRYASILRSLAGGPLSWSGILERARGIASGAQLAPYLRRLEEEGLVRVDLPLGAGPGSRSRRYAHVDPFLAFWFGWVLPVRSLIPTIGARAIWEKRIRGSLGRHFQAWMEEAARRWLREHAVEGLGAPSREAGGLWGAEAEFPVAGRLANGQVCYGLVDWEMRTGDLSGEMARRMSDTRYGIGRQARAALFFLGGEGDENLRRAIARDPLNRIVDLAMLMGSE